MRRIAMETIAIVSGRYFDAARDLFGFKVPMSACGMLIACPYVESADLDYEPMVHKDCYKISRMEITSPDPLRGTLKRRLNSLQARF
jgi:hypothetical protein